MGILPNLEEDERSRFAPAEELIWGRLWRSLFGTAVEIVGATPPDRTVPYWPAGLGPAPEAPVFSWLGRPDHITAWLNSTGALQIAEACGRPLDGVAADLPASLEAPGLARAIEDETGLAPFDLGDRQLDGAPTRCFSTLIHVDERAALTLVGSIERVLGPDGRTASHRGLLDWRGRGTSGHGKEEVFREAAAAVARVAARRGLRGPCSVEAVALGGAGRPESVHPITGLHFGFTRELVALGLLRRVLAVIREQTGLEPGEQRAVGLWLEPPLRAERPGEPAAVQMRRLEWSDGVAGPTLILAADCPTLESWLGGDGLPARELPRS